MFVISKLFQVEIPPNTEYLCFPDVGDCPMDDSHSAQCYSLMITKATGERVYGYCRRVIPEGSRNCLPLVYCILSKHRASTFYKKILKEIEMRHGVPDKLIEHLINQFYSKPFPCPGECIRIDMSKMIGYDDRLFNCTNEGCNDLENSFNALDLNSYVIVDRKGGYGTLRKMNSGMLFTYENNPKKPLKSFLPYRFDMLTDCSIKKSNSSPLLSEYNHEFIITLHQDSRYDDTNLKKLCDSLNSTILQKVFASLLLERKVIFVSCILR